MHLVNANQQKKTNTNNTSGTRVAHRFILDYEKCETLYIFDFQRNF